MRTPASRARTMGSIKAEETKRAQRTPLTYTQMTIKLPDKHFKDAIRAEAGVRGMSVNSFMRAMIRGYFGAA